MNKLCSPYLEETFCKLLEQYPLIWDKNAPDFKNKSRRREAWKIMSQSLNYPVDALVKKYKSMREKYRREQIFELNDVRNGGDGPERTPWPMKKHLEFLGKVIVPRKSHHFYCKSEEAFLDTINDHSSSTEIDNFVIKDDSDVQDPFLAETATDTFTPEVTPFVQPILAQEAIIMKNERLSINNDRLSINNDHLSINNDHLSMNNEHTLPNKPCALNNVVINNVHTIPNNDSSSNNDRIALNYDHNDKRTEADADNVIDRLQAKPRGIKRKESTASAEAEDIVKSLTCIVERLQEKTVNNHEDGEFESFGKFVGNSLAGIEEDLADEATSEIMQVLIKYKKLHRRKVNS